MGDRHARANMQGRTTQRGGTVDARAPRSDKEGAGTSYSTPKSSEEKYYPGSPA